MAAIPSGYTATVSALGWELEVLFPSWTIPGVYAPDPDGTPTITLTVTSKGFDNTGTLGTIVRTVVVTDVLRKPDPNETAQDEVDAAGDCTTTFVLSDFIFAGDIVVMDTLAGWAQDGSGTPVIAELFDTVTITNSSALTYSQIKPVARWAMPEIGHYITSGTQHVELCAFSAYPQSGGKQVAAVKFTIDDGGGNTNTVTVTEATVSTLYSNDQHAVLVYEADLPISGLNDGAATIRAQVYPWVGGDTGTEDAIRDSNDGTENFFDFEVYIDTANGYPPVYAYVKDGAAGSAPAVSETRGDVENDDTVKCYADAGAAMEAIKAYNSTNYSRPDEGNGRVLLGDGTNRFIGTNSTTTTGRPAVWCTIEPSSGSTVTINIPTSSGTTGRRMLHYSGITINQTSANATGIDMADDTDGRVWFDGCTCTDGNDYVPLVRYRVRKTYWTNGDATNLNLGAFGASNTTVPLVRASNLTPADGDAGKADCMIGCTLNGFGLKETSANWDAPDNGMLAFSSLLDISNPGLILGEALNVKSFAIVQNVIEMTTAAAAIVVSADSDNTTAENILIYHPTIPGSRVNIGYNDALGSIQLNHLIFIKGAIFDDIAVKSDTYAGQATAIQNWSFMYQVGCEGNITTHDYDDLDFTPANTTGATANHAYDGRNSSLEPAAGADVTFTDDKSLGGDGLGGGDYTISVDGDELNRLTNSPVGGDILPFDLAGVARTYGRAGAYDIAAPVVTSTSYIKQIAPNVKEQVYTNVKSNFSA